MNCVTNVEAYKEEVEPLIEEVGIEIDRMTWQGGYTTQKDCDNAATCNVPGGTDEEKAARIRGQDIRFQWIIIGHSVGLFTEFTGAL
jgi:hypothetical protein